MVVPRAVDLRRSCRALAHPPYPRRTRREPASSDAPSSLFNKTTSHLSGAVSSPIAGPLAAWMPPPSPRGRVYGVPRER
ncbi:hypothetical protein DZD52_10665 [Xanthomonas nasturtii]|uniref:Uncharacterized protein n=1 Tax=Xanthomonas nasturtii TaxID=1843581 RepID=A0A3E1KJX2_9XANT|nr:hypothetical protein DZD52_10665 [Xanthomonas nasturtii]